MNPQDCYIGHNAKPSSEEEQQSLAQLKRLMKALNDALPSLPPQYDATLGNALLNLALNRLIDAHGQEATANMLAGAAEMLWNNGWKAPELGQQN